MHLCMMLVYLCSGTKPYMQICPNVCARVLRCVYPAAVKII